MRYQFMPSIPPSHIAAPLLFSLPLTPPPPLPTAPTAVRCVATLSGGGQVGLLTEVSLTYVVTEARVAMACVLVQLVMLSRTMDEF